VVGPERTQEKDVWGGANDPKNGEQRTVLCENEGREGGTLMLSRQSQKSQKRGKKGDRCRDAESRRTF